MKRYRIKLSEMTELIEEIFNKLNEKQIYIENIDLENKEKAFNKVFKSIINEINGKIQELENEKFDLNSIRGFYKNYLRDKTGANIKQMTNKEKEEWDKEHIEEYEKIFNADKEKNIKRLEFVKNILYKNKIFIKNWLISNEVGDSIFYDYINRLTIMISKKIRHYNNKLLQQYLYSLIADFYREIGIRIFS